MTCRCSMRGRYATIRGTGASRGLTLNLMPNTIGRRATQTHPGRRHAKACVEVAKMPSIDRTRHQMPVRRGHAGPHRARIRQEDLKIVLTQLSGNVVIRSTREFVERVLDAIAKGYYRHDQ